jgi:AraC family transcriptional regulator, regulatory protein of adaptative response / DNA-3-methyladenine glycosylase II
MSGVPGFTSAALHRARLARDARFDGRFFIAVLSTRIYCRPICPSPRCKRSNVLFYATAAAAEAAGYRACRRCRPEVAPGSAAWLGPSAVVRRALRLIQDGTLDDGTVEELATRVGVGARHLSRLFVEHVGVSPIAVAITRRLHFSKQLLDETSWPITRVAMASGFRSLRRFNESYRETFKCSPRESRRRRRAGAAATRADQVALTLPYRPPYDWAALCAFLGKRAVAGVERVDARGYARTVRLDRGHALIRVSPVAGTHTLRLEVARASPGYLFEIATTARRMFDLSADPAQIASALGVDPLLARPVAQHPGLRIPGIWDPFECAVRAILGENIDRAAVPGLLERLVQRCEDPLEEPLGELTHLFPSPAGLATANLDGIGLTSASVTALTTLARVMLEGTLDFLASADAVANALEGLPGIGASAAQYVVLRELGEPDAFPLTESVLQRLFGTKRLPPVDAIEERTQFCRPWRGYAALHLCAQAAAPRQSAPSLSKSLYGAPDGR